MTCPREGGLAGLSISRMHKPGDEKRLVVILPLDDWKEWLATWNVEVARAML